MLPATLSSPKETSELQDCTSKKETKVSKYSTKRPNFAQKRSKWKAYFFQAGTNSEVNDQHPKQTLPPLKFDF